MQDNKLEILKNSLKSLKRDEAISFLHQYAVEEKDPKILLFIVKEIGKHKDSSSADVLINLLTCFNENRDHYLEVRSTAATILGNLKYESAILPLMDIMNDRDESYRLRLWAADALGKIGNSQAVVPLIRIVSDEEEKSLYLKESAAKALGMIGDERAVDSLINILEVRQGMMDRFTFLKEKAIEALGRLKPQKETRLQALKNVLNDESPQVRASAIDALAQIEDDDITLVIEPMIYDNNEEVARTAICALYNREGREFIVNLLKKDNLPASCRDEIMDILEELDEEEDDE